MTERDGSRARARVAPSTRPGGDARVRRNSQAAAQGPPLTGALRENARRQVELDARPPFTQKGRQLRLMVGEGLDVNAAGELVARVGSGLTIRKGLLEVRPADPQNDLDPGVTYTNDQLRDAHNALLANLREAGFLPEV